MPWLAETGIDARRLRYTPHVKQDPRVRRRQTMAAVGCFEEDLLRKQPTASQHEQGNGDGRVNMGPWCDLNVPLHIISARAILHTRYIGLRSASSHPITPELQLQLPKEPSTLHQT
ncbi:hypothetical protein HER10_EVM0009615 [Colletotrichum scovillei]|uniref:uncharacterized protein n=1 Tax=Colletotrichum scovillei TaxID=1209932 RepID=UPI0015C34FAC|nr:uncharacterized protein HER10_EVM0009615 [Colletotrichum scovillei]KAF4783406.1 hypothetical protein HER10_EVM0009615 [Colletotrichum scovillei]